MKLANTHFNEPIKCGACGYETSNFYYYEGDDYKDSGLCADCFMEMLADMDTDITVSINKPVDN
jgi:hypothetical protein